MLRSVSRAVLFVPTGQLHKIDSMKEVLRHVRLSREKMSRHYKSSKSREKDSVVKLMAKSVVSFVTEEVHSSEVHSDTVGVSPPTVAAAMGNQQIRAQVGYYRLHWLQKHIMVTNFRRLLKQRKKNMHTFHDKCKVLKTLMHFIYVMTCGTYDNGD